jgi:hypothetical protein
MHAAVIAIPVERRRRRRSLGHQIGRASRAGDCDCDCGSRDAGQEFVCTHNLVSFWLVQVIGQCRLTTAFSHCDEMKINIIHWFEQEAAIPVLIVFVLANGQGLLKKMNNNKSL